MIGGPAFWRNLGIRLERRRILREFAPNFAFGCAKNADLAVILHLFYFDLWQEIQAYLANIPHDFDLYLSIPPDFSPVVLRDLLARYPRAAIRIVENRGRDIAPFLLCLSEICDSGYTAVCKLHSKKSPHLADGRGWRPETGETWRNQLYEELLGSPRQVERILAAFARDERLGMAGPSANWLRYLDYEGDNRVAVGELMRRLRIEGEEFRFFAGSMFWFRPRYLKNVAALNLRPVEFPAERAQVDGTLAHAVERILAAAICQSGGRVATTTELTQSG